MRTDIDAGALVERGKTLHRQGRQDEAEALYRQALEVDSENADALHMLGVIANQRGEYKQAASLIGKAIQRKPGAEHFHSNLGLALMGSGELDAACIAFLAELERFPASHASHVNLGALLHKLRRYEQAIEHYRTALSMLPDDFEVLNNLGVAHLELRQFESAEEVARKSLGLRGANPEALNLLGLVSRQQGRPEDALGYFIEALKLKPMGAEILFNAGVACREMGDYERALAYYDQALALKPDYPDPHYSRGRALLALGRFEEGWREHEYGLLCGERSPRPRPYPVWTGGALENRALLLSAEQGLGDEIMFASVLPDVIERASQCIVECDARLLPIYRRSFPSVILIPRSFVAEPDPAEQIERIDLQLPLGSLPLHYRRSAADFPRHNGYLKADPAKVADWKNRLDALGPGLKIGISWRGGTPKTGSDRRSLPLEEWMPLLGRQGIQFVSLQYTECSEEIAALARRHGVNVTHWQQAIEDYEETAALVSALDFVITIQTAIFHLSGALGRPVWGMISDPPEWRYQQKGESLPWYPSARLFRQRTPGDWQQVLKDVSASLDDLVRPGA